MNEATIIQEASRVLAARLPAGWKQRVTRLQSRPQGRPDAILDVTGPDGARVRVSVEAKTGLVPRAVADLKTQLESYSSDPGLVVSPFLTRSTRERLRAENLNFLDLTGNVRLVLARPGLVNRSTAAWLGATSVRPPSFQVRSKTTLSNGASSITFAPVSVGRIFSAAAADPTLST